jgi:RHS repeat-associated protein
MGRGEEIHDWQYRRTSQVVSDPGGGNRLELSLLHYDPAGNLETVVDAAGIRSATYGYDDLSRLTSAAWGATSREYHYDAIGNLTSLVVPGQGSRAFAYVMNSDGLNTPVLATVGGAPVVTDQAGNITTDDRATYGYTASNHLASRTLDAQTSDYTFTGDGRLAESSRPGKTFDVVLGLGGQRISRILDSVERDYIWLGSSLVAYYDGPTGDPVHVLTNHIGFPLMAVDASGTSVWEPLAEPYGELIGPFSKTFDPGLRYPGQWQDDPEVEGTCVGDLCTMPGPLEASASMFENGYRWYRAAWGRYTQADPVGERRPIIRPGSSKSSRSKSPGENLFQYVRNSPYVSIDFFGLCESCDYCPSGIWKYSGNVVSGGEMWGGVWWIGGGIMGSEGEFQCVTKRGFKHRPPIPVGITCEVDRAVGVDIGVDFLEKSFGRGASGCNKDDILGAIEGWVYSVGPFGFANTGSEGGDSSWTGEFSVSLGLGAAKISCKVRER